VSIAQRFLLTALGLGVLLVGACAERGLVRPVNGKEASANTLDYTVRRLSDSTLGRRKFVCIVDLCAASVRSGIIQTCTSSRRSDTCEGTSHCIPGSIECREEKVFNLCLLRLNRPEAFGRAVPLRDA